jgi:hypothetical protein
MARAGKHRSRRASEVEIDGQILLCFVCASFQPFLEALRSHEVISHGSTAAHVRET